MGFGSTGTGSESKTIPTDSIKPDAPSILLLLGLSTSLLSVGMGTLVPSFIQGGTLMLVAAGVIWSAAEPARQERNRSLAYWPILLVITGILPSLLNSTDLQTSHGRHWPFYRSRSPSSWPSA